MFGRVKLPPFLISLILINLTGHMALSGGRVAGSIYILRDHGSEALVGIFMALFSLIAVMTSLRIGRWVDRAGAARVMRVGVIMVALGAWLPVVVLRLETLFICALAIGCGFNLMAVASQHTVGHLSGGLSVQQRMGNFGWFAMGHSASSTLAPFITGLCIDALGFRYAYALLAAIACVSAVLVYTRLNHLRTHAHPSESSAENSVMKPPTQQPVFDLLKQPDLRRIYLVNMVMAASWDLFIVMLPVLGHRQDFSASVIGIVFSMFALGTFLARAAMPLLSRIFIEWQILRVSLIVMALVFCILPWVKLAPGLMLMGLAFGAAVGMSQPNMLSLLHGSAPAGRGGEAVGLRSVLSNGVSIFIPVSFGLLVLPLGLPFLLFGGAALAGFAVWPIQSAIAESKNA
jgi:predicted MFS family arabinose efflux permease